VKNISHYINALVLPEGYRIKWDDTTDNIVVDQGKLGFKVARAELERRTFEDGVAYIQKAVTDLEKCVKWNEVQQ
jgi:hypothetical protein